MKLVLFVIRLALGALLLWGGLVKARQPYEFLGTVYTYQILGPGTGMLVAAWLPWLEVVLGSVLLSGILAEGALLVATGLSTLFALAVISAWHRGLGIPCGCFGASKATIDVYTVVRSLGLVLLSGLGLAAALRLHQRQTKAFLHRGRRRTDPFATHISVPGRSSRPSLWAVIRHPRAGFATALFRRFSDRARVGGRG